MTRTRMNSFDIILGDDKIASFKYALPKSRDKALQKALEFVLEKLLGPDVDPWEVIKENKVL